MSKTRSLCTGGLKLLGFFTKLGSKLLSVLWLSVKYSINLTFYKMFLHQFLIHLCFVLE